MIELKELITPFKDTAELKKKNTQVQKHLEKLNKDTKLKKLKKYQRDLKYNK